MAAPLHIAVCGAGIAGLASSLALSAQGHRITLFDQFEAPRPLGSGLILQPTGLAVLDWLGLGQRIRGLGARIDRLYGKASGSGRVVLDVRYDVLGDERGLAVHRAALFNVLHDAVRAQGIEVETASHVKDLDDNSVILNQDRREGLFDLVVDALGSRSPLIPHAAGPDYRSALGYGAIWASLPWPGAPFDVNALEQRYDRASVMIGVLPIGRQVETAPEQAAFFWSLKAADFEAWRKAGLDQWKHTVLGHWPDCAGLLDTVTDASQMVMARYDHHTLSLPFGRRIVFIGDSAHATSPQLGQGANMALLDVHALAAALKENADLRDALGSYARKRRFHVKLYQGLSRVFTPFYQSDSTLLPMARDHLVSSISRIGPAQKLLARIVSGKFGLPRT
ncbi:FAD-dependent oxidoreductase [Aestuariivirga sp.]|uniref:FAD-dependent oxidoreductase n=1 Tax=Aestuariivirga sp. TaxID=2650926 RepID=UPI00359322DB